MTERRKLARRALREIPTVDSDADARAWIDRHGLPLIQALREADTKIEGAADRVRRATELVQAATGKMDEIRKFLAAFRVKTGAYRNRTVGATKARWRSAQALVMVIENTIAEFLEETAKILTGRALTPAEPPSEERREEAAQRLADLASAVREQGGSTEAVERFAEVVVKLRRHLLEGKALEDFDPLSDEEN